MWIWILNSLKWKQWSHRNFNKAQYLSKCFVPLLQTTMSIPKSQKYVPSLHSDSLTSYLLDTVHHTLHTSWFLLHPPHMCYHCTSAHTLHDPSQHSYLQRLQNTSCLFHKHLLFNIYKLNITKQKTKTQTLKTNRNVTKH